MINYADHIDRNLQTLHYAETILYKANYKLCIMQYQSCRKRCMKSALRSYNHVESNLYSALCSNHYEVTIW